MERRRDDLTHADRRGLHGAEAGKTETEPGGFGELHDGRVADRKVARTHALPAGTHDFNRKESAARGLLHHLERPFPAVGDGEGLNLRFGKHVPGGALNLRGRLARGERTLEAVGKDENFHGETFGYWAIENCLPGKIETKGPSGAREEDEHDSADRVLILSRPKKTLETRHPILRRR